MSTKHTPGPWTFGAMGVDEDNKPTDTHWISGPCGCLGHIYPDRETPTGVANAEANARLISAGPEMLEALQNQVARMAKLAREKGIVIDVSEIQDTIAKATGDS